MRGNVRGISWAEVAFMLGAGAQLACLGCATEAPVALDTTDAVQAPILLDQEERLGNAAISASTQSVNRGHSVLRDLRQVRLGADSAGAYVGLDMLDGDGVSRVTIEGIPASHLVPLLPYPRPDPEPDAFDLANLMLAEYARLGVALSHQASNRDYGVFHARDGYFDGLDGEEYRFEEGEIRANGRVRPTRLVLANNCLRPGLWELSATDSVGEIYHGWIDLPLAPYLHLVRQVNRLALDDDALATALTYRAELPTARLALERLRTAGPSLLTTDVEIILDRPLGGYSTQESRRKLQRRFVQVHRNGQPLEVERFTDLAEGDQLALRAFIEPGIYSATEHKVVPFETSWRSAEVREVKPRTRFSDQKSLLGEDQGHLEIWIHDEAQGRAVVMGNIPLALLVFQEDYAIEAFGVGVLGPSELAERRALRMTEGPAPHYAYLVARQDRAWQLLNHHEGGFEQVFLRPFERDGNVVLRVGIVSYERIAELIRVEIPLDDTLGERIRAASRAYQPPLFRVYRDDNVL